MNSCGLLVSESDIVSSGRLRPTKISHKHAQDTFQQFMGLTFCPYYLTLDVPVICSLTPTVPDSFTETTTCLHLKEVKE